jgi:hypothetical protein
MTQGRRTAFTVTLTADDRATLLAWQRATMLPAGQACRARTILLLADGVAISTIAGLVGRNRRFVYKWIRRFLQEGIAGLLEKPGRGQRAHGTDASAAQDSCA